MVADSNMRWSLARSSATESAIAFLHRSFPREPLLFLLLR